MPTRLAQVRKVRGGGPDPWANIELLTPATLATPADVLAKAAGKFAVQAAVSTDLKLNQMVTAPDPTELGEAIGGVPEAGRTRRGSVNRQLRRESYAMSS